MLGAVVCVIAAIVAGFYKYYLLSILLSLLYFIGLIVLILYTQYKIKFFEQRFLVNLGIIL